MILNIRKALRIGTIAALIAAALPIALSALQTYDDDGNIIDDGTGSEMTNVEEGYQEEVPTELSIEDLENMIGGKTGEAQEDPKGTSLLSDAATRQSIFGTNAPKFVYINQGADPMIIPWVRSAIVAQELWERAATLRTAGEREQAIEVLKNLIDQVPESPEAKNAPGAISAIQKEIGGPGTTTPTTITTPTTEKITLPNEVVINTTGVLLSAEPKVLVFDYILQVGDRIPRYAAIRVKAITPSQVIYEYEGEEFAVDVDGRF